MLRNPSFAVVLAAFLFTPTLPIAGADDWLHWRGPTGNGVASNANPPTSFSDTDNVKWKVPIPGRGSGSPVIWKDRIFLTTAFPTSGGKRGPHRFLVLCIDRNTGKTIWNRQAVEATPHEGTHSTNGFASASPCTDGKHVYAHFGSQGLYCYTMDGELVWKRDDFGQMRTRNEFGEGSSPTLVDDAIIVPWDHEGPSSLYLLDKLTGETIWQVQRDEPTNWATPLVVQHNGQKQIVMNGQTCARGYDLATGEELWRCGGQTDRPAASAVAGDQLIYVGSGFRGSYLGAFRINSSGDIEGTDAVVWNIDRHTPDIASPLLSENRLYFYSGKRGLLSCVDAATGKIHYQAARIDDLDSIYASPVAAGGYVYLSDRDGTVVVIKDQPTLEVVATNQMGETIDATPAPVDDQLIIRGERHLFCIAK